MEEKDASQNAVTWRVEGINRGRSWAMPGLVAGEVGVRQEMKSR